MRLRYIQHEPFEDPGTILEWAAERGHSVSGTMVYKGEPLPPLNSFDMLVIMGGSMSVNEEDRWPWMAPEKKLVARAVKGGMAVLGVCLGAQIIASALGAKVYKNPCKEIGWFPVTLTEQGITSRFFLEWPLMFPVFHWHGDTFDIPDGAVRLASSKVCANQAFVFGRNTVALQFHTETTAENLETLLSNGGDEVAAGGPFVQSAQDIRDHKQYLSHLRTLMFKLLDALEKGGAAGKNIAKK
jgi:GMP synthase-like glutamine amidotransferase